MRILIGAVLISISLLHIACTNEKIQPIYIVDACIVAIDSTYSFDRGLNEGDTLFLEFSNELNLNELDKSKILNNLKEKYKLPICISSLHYLTNLEKLTPYHPNLKNFIIGIEKIYYEDKKTIVIKSFKYKGMLASDIVETIFKYKDGRWNCCFSKISSVS